MTTLGIVGGIAPPSTVEYYRSALAAWKARTGGSLPILVDSLDTEAFFALLRADDRLAIVARLVAEIQRLANAGADLAIIASNTGHIGFEAIRAASPIPLTGIVDATADVLAADGRRRVGLFATTFTIRADVYGPTLAERGIACIVPPEADQERIQSIYFGELVEARFLAESRDELLAIAARLRRRERVDAIVLGGTELPLLLTEPERDGLPFLDTGRIHVDAAIDALLALEESHSVSS